MLWAQTSRQEMRFSHSKSRGMIASRLVDSSCFQRSTGDVYVERQSVIHPWQISSPLFVHEETFMEEVLCSRERSFMFIRMFFP